MNGLRSLCAGVLLICLGLMGTAAAAEPAEEPLDEDKFVDVVEYTIESGDTFFNLAQRFYKDAEKSYIIENANANLNPKKLKPGDKIRIPVTATGKAWWEMHGQKAEDAVEERLSFFGLSPEAIRSAQLSVGIGFWFFTAFNVIVAIGLLMWFASKIARIPEVSFRKAALCTAAEMACMVGLVFALLGFIDFMSGYERIKPILEAGSPYGVIVVLVLADLLILRVVFRIGWLRSFALSVSRLAAMAAVVAVLFGLASVINIIWPSGT